MGIGALMGGQTSYAIWTHPYRMTIHKQSTRILTFLSTVNPNGTLQQQTKRFYAT